MAADEDSKPVTELQPIAGITSKTRSAGTDTPGRANTNTFGENESSNHPSFPSETSITMAAEQDENSPFDSTLTFVLHKLVGIDFTKDTIHKKYITVLTDLFVSSWEDFIKLPPTVILNLEQNNALKDKLLAIQAFERSHHTGDEEVDTPNSITYTRLLFRKFIRGKDFCSLALNDNRSNTSPRHVNKSVPTVELNIVDVDHNGNLVTEQDEKSPFEQDEKSPFDSSLTFVFHTMFGVDFTKEPRNKFIGIIVDNNVTTWEDFIHITPKMILDMDNLDDWWKEKILGLKAFAESLQDKYGKIVTPNSINYKRSILRKFMRHKDFSTLALSDIRSNY